MRDLILVAAGGALGAVTRYLVGGWIQSAAGWTFPIGTYAINVTGSFLIGIVLGLAESGALTAPARLFLAVGLMGGYTTFSSFSYENLQLLRSGALGALILNAGGQLALGLLAVYLGVVVARMLGGIP